MSYTIKIEGLDQLIKNFEQSPKMVTKELTDAIKTSIHIIRPMMMKEAPHDKGGLRKNIFAKIKGLIGTVGPDVNATPYAWYVHEGTGIYAGRGRIFAKRAKALKMNIGGKIVFAKSIKGQRPNPFVERTVDKMTPIVQKIFDKAGDKIVNNLAK